MREVFESTLTAMTANMLMCAEPSEEANEEVVSSWTLAHFCIEMVRIMLRATWSTARKQQCREHLLRYVRSCPRPRGHSESEQRTWFQARAAPVVS